MTDHSESTPPNASDAHRRQEDVPLDVRALPHFQRHQTIFNVLPRLAAGQALVITVDHDPQPLRFQLNALHPGQFGWEYLDRGPDIWQVAIRRHDEA